ncbi:hypothetical protein ABZ860_41425 [Microbispora sp. NPDC046973]|uniref:hypothetical protein n=1 Tax=Microbispora sp. NPDC046973 TaxID=3155022 RepID=UPI0033D2ADA9
MLAPLRQALAAGVVSLSAAAAAMAAAPPARAQTGLPPIGAEIPSSMLALDSTLEFHGTTFSLDFRGGIKQRVEPNPDDPVNSVRLRTVGFRVSGEGDSDTSVVFEQCDIDTEAASTLRLTQRFPPRYEERDVLPFCATFTRPDSEPLTLTTKDPMILTATLTQYPARGDLYQLAKPVDLVEADSPDTVVARLTAFASKRGGL